ncbi:MAG: hypothetical protein HRU11_12615 [Parvularculaceae bacterium]|nr:hypothetical protein [Epibacterium sp.]NQX74755.1 hypothetical protein [Epibacterium sp.]NRA31089.1 hypothetical protein [Parvularculaceae bacterium]
MLIDALRYMEAISIIDEQLAELEKAGMNPRTPDDLCRELRIRHKAIADVRDLISGKATTLPHS